MKFDDFWYIVAESHEVSADKVVGAKVLSEWLVVFRDATGKAVVFRDRCMHRAGRLSKGRVCHPGQLQCPYHGWTYDGEGQLVGVPAEGEQFKQTLSRLLKQYSVREQEGFVYVRLSDGEQAATMPFAMPQHGQRGWRSVRLVNRFRNNVTNCVENFIDVPHTVFVHPGIFREPRRERVEATIKRSAGRVHAEYRGESDNLGWFKRFLNPKGEGIVHTDEFVMPNVTTVYYRFAQNRELYITSQSVPVEDDETLVYTDLTYNFGVWTRFAGPILRYQGQAVIDQDLVALASQMEVIDKYGEAFANTDADVIHVYVESIRRTLAKDGDPYAMRDKETDIVFWV